MNTITKKQKKQKKQKFTEEDRQFEWGENLHDDEEYIIKTVETTNKKGIFEVTKYTWRYICQTYFCKGIEEVIETIH